MTDYIQVEHRSQICIVSINRADKKNALTHDMYEALSDALVGAQNDKAVRACILATTGVDFTSGNDLKDFLEQPELSRDSGGGRFIEVISTFEKPLIAAVEGLSVGIGATLLLHCDFVYAGESSCFIFPFVKLALVPEAGSSLLLQQVVGRAKAAELLMLGKPLSAPDAKSYGLVNETCEDGMALQWALKTADEICELPPQALCEIKKLMRASLPHLKNQIDAEMQVFTSSLSTAESREAFQAFLEKRKPDFSKL